MKPHYFDQKKPDEDDHLLQMAVMQGYVPENCLLNGQLVMGLVSIGESPCVGCHCDRSKCQPVGDK